MSEAFLVSLIGGVGALALGIAIGYAYRHAVASKRVSAAERKAVEMLQDAKRREHEFLLKAKEKGLKIVEDAKREETERRHEVAAMQQRIEKRESLFDQKLLELQTQQTRAEEQRAKLTQAQQRLEELHREEAKALEAIAQLWRREGEERLLAHVEEEVRDALTSRIRKLETENSEEIERRSRV